jgi:hypothetical protein
VINRDIGVDIILDRMRNNNNELNLSTLKYVPSVPLSTGDVPALMLIPGPDIIIGRQRSCKPSRRQFDITAELITKDDFDINTCYNNIRRILFTDKNLAADIRIEEGGTVGPQAYPIPHLIGLQLIIRMYYEDTLTNY